MRTLTRNGLTFISKKLKTAPKFQIPREIESFEPSKTDSNNRLNTYLFWEFTFPTFTNIKYF